MRESSFVIQIEDEQPVRTKGESDAADKQTQVPESREVINAVKDANRCPHAMWQS